MQLRAAKPLERVTVRELADLADISKATFLPLQRASVYGSFPRVTSVSTPGSVTTTRFMAAVPAPRKAVMA